MTMVDPEVRAALALTIKEVRVHLRGRAFWWAQRLYLASLVVAVAGLVMTRGDEPLWQLGQRLFSVVMRWQALAVLLVAPTLLAGSLTLEREHKNAVLLASLPLGPGALAAGKFAGGLVPLALLMLTGLPFVALAVPLGGVAASQVAAGWVVCMAAAALAGSLGLVASVLARRSSDAVATVVASVLSATVVSSILSKVNAVSTPLLINPLLALDTVFEPWRHVPGMPWSGWAWGVVLDLWGTVSLILLARHLLSRQGVRDPSPHRLAVFAWLVLLLGGMAAGVCLDDRLPEFAAHGAPRGVASLGLLVAVGLGAWLGVRPLSSGSTGVGTLAQRDLVAAASVGALAGACAAVTLAVLMAADPSTWHLAPGAVPILDGSAPTRAPLERALLLGLGVALTGLITALLGKLLTRTAARTEPVSRFVLLVVLLGVLRLVPEGVLDVWQPGASRSMGTSEEQLATHSLPEWVRMIGVLDPWRLTNALASPGERVTRDRKLWWDVRLSPDPRIAVALYAAIVLLLLWWRRQQGRAHDRCDQEAPPGTHTRGLDPRPPVAPSPPAAALVALLVAFLAMAPASEAARPPIQVRLDWDVGSPSADQRAGLVRARFDADPKLRPTLSTAHVVAELRGKGYSGLGSREATLLRVTSALQPDSGGILEALLPLATKGRGYASVFEMTLVDGVSVLGRWRQSIDAGGPGETILVLALGGRPELRRGAAAHGVAIKDVSPGGLPRSTWALRRYDALIVDDDSLLRLEPSQAEALDRWVLMGGRLVLSAPALQAGVPVRWRPAEVTSARPVPVATGPATRLLVRGGSPLAEARALSLRAPKERWIASDQRVPLVVARPHGAGRIVGLAIDPAWCLQGGRPLDATRDRWQDVLVGAVPGMRAPSYNAMTVARALIPPSRRAVVARRVARLYTGLTLLVIGLLVWFASSRPRRHLWAVLVAPVLLVAIVAGAAIVAGMSRSSGLELRQVQILWADSASPSLLADDLLGIGASGHRSVSIVAEGDGVELDPLVGTGLLALSPARHRLLFEPEAKRLTLGDQRLSAGAMRFIRARGRARVHGSVEARATFDSSGIALVLDNRLRLPLEAAVLIAGRRHVALGDVRPGGGATARLDLPWPAADVVCAYCRAGWQHAGHAAAPSWAATPGGALAAEALDHLLVHEPPATTAGPFVLARVPEAPRILSGPSGHGLAQTVLVARPERDVAPGPFAIPADLCIGEPLGADPDDPFAKDPAPDARQDQADDGPLAGVQPGPVHLRFRLPIRGPDTRIERATMVVWGVPSLALGAAARIRIVIRRPDGRPGEVVFDSGRRRTATPLARSAMFFDAEHGTFTATVESELGPERPIAVPTVGIAVSGSDAPPAGGTGTPGGPDAVGRRKGRPSR